MTAGRSLVDRVLLFAAVPLFLIGGLVAVDLLAAANAPACPATDCYPWGGEGPAADYLRYRSRETYLALGLVQSIAPAIAIGLCMIGWRKGGMTRIGRATAAILLGISGALLLV
jgi:hypothetical protein